MNRIIYNLIKKKGSYVNFDLFKSKIALLMEGKYLPKLELFLEIISNDTSNKTSRKDLETAFQF